MHQKSLDTFRPSEPVHHAFRFPQRVLFSSHKYDPNPKSEKANAK